MGESIYFYYKNRNAIKFKKKILPIRQVRKKITMLAIVLDEKLYKAIIYEGQDKLPTIYWLPKLHKRPYKARFIANSSSFTTTELTKLLTSCLTAIKSQVIRYWFWSIEILARCSVN